MAQMGPMPPNDSPCSPQPSWSSLKSASGSAPRTPPDPRMRRWDGESWRHHVERLAVQRVSLGWAAGRSGVLPMFSHRVPSRTHWGRLSGPAMGVHAWDTAPLWMADVALGALVAERPRSRLAIFRDSRRRAEQICMLRRQWWVNRCGDSEHGGSSAEQSHVLASRKRRVIRSRAATVIGSQPGFSLLFRFITTWAAGASLLGRILPVVTGGPPPQVPLVSALAMASASAVLTWSSVMGGPGRVR